MIHKVHQQQHGFTLLEVLAAFLIAVFSLILVFSIWNGAILRTALTERQELALALAQSLIDEQRTLRIATAGTTMGTTSGLEWSVTRQEYGPPSSVPGIEWRPMRIDVEVTWTALTGAQTLALSSIVLVMNI
jgi:type II secretory pathway pseudopilin PulG